MLLIEDSGPLAIHSPLRDIARNHVIVRPGNRLHPPGSAPVYADVIYGCENVIYPESRKSVLHGITAALLHMQKQKSGHIVNTAAVFGIKLFASGGTVYCATKDVPLLSPKAGACTSHREQIFPLFRANLSHSFVSNG